MKAVLHRGGHTSISTHAAFFDWGHLWLDHFLWGINNNVVEDMPNVQISCSIRGTYESFDSWPIPGSKYTRYFLNPLSPAEMGAAGTFSLEVPVTREFKIRDSLIDWRTWAPNDNTLRPWPTTTGTITRTLPTGAHINAWEQRVFAVRNLAAPSTERLVFVSDITENVRMNGTVVVSLEVASDRPWGNITAALVEINSGNAAQPGGNGRLQPGSTTVRTIPAHNGVGAISLTAPTAMTTPGATGQWRNYRLITSGTVDVQNPNPFIVTPEEFPHLPGPRGRTFMEAGKTNFVPEYYYSSISPVPGEAHVYTFMFETYDWEFMAGNQMAVMVYSTDYRYTFTPPNPPELTIITGENTFIDIPSLTPFNVEGALHTVTFDAAGGEQVGGGKLDQVLRDGDVAIEPVVERFGYTFAGWVYDDELFDFETPITEDMAIAATWDLLPISAMRITDAQGELAAALITVPRNSTLQLGALTYDALPYDIDWAVNNPLFATVDANGLVTIRNVPGMVIVTVTAPSGVRHAITLRIT